MIFQFIVLLGLLIFVLFQRSKKPKNFPPGPPRLPFLGSIPYLRKYETTYLRTMDLAEEYGDVVGFYAAKNPIVLLSNFEDIKEVYKMEEAAYRPPSVFQGVLRYAGENGEGTKGILFSSGDAWREQRRFTLKNLRDFGFGKSSMEDMIKGQVNKLGDSLSKDLGSPTVLDFKLNVAVLNSLWVILVGEELHTDNPVHAEAMQSLNELVRGGGQSRIGQLFPFLVKMFPDYFLKEPSKAARKVKAMIKPIREEHRETLDSANPRDFLDVHMAAQKEAGKNSSFYGLAGQQHEEITLLDLFIAGAETTSTSISWGILYLLHHPDIQEKIQQEMDDLLHGSREPSLEDEKDLPYFSATLLEIQRCASIVYSGVPHYTKEEITVQGYTIPKGTVLFANILKVMHNPAVFKDPLVFNPDRFIDADGKVKSHPHLIPFLTGKRLCLGLSLAEKSLFVFMSQLLYKFKFTAEPGKHLPSYSIKSRTETSHTIIRFPPVYKVVMQERLNQ